MSNTDRMTDTRFTITIDIQPDSDHEAEDIFDAVQLLLADEFGGEAEASFGSPDELIDGDDMAEKVMSYLLQVSFRSSRRLTMHEIHDLESAVAAQVEEPTVTNADGDHEDATYLTTDVIVSTDDGRADG